MRGVGCVCGWRRILLRRRTLQWLHGRICLYLFASCLYFERIHTDVTDQNCIALSSGGRTLTSLSNINFWLIFRHLTTAVCALSFALEAFEAPMEMECHAPFFPPALSGSSAQLYYLFIRWIYSHQLSLRTCGISCWRSAVLERKKKELAFFLSCALAFYTRIDLYRSVEVRETSLALLFQKKKRTASWMPAEMRKYKKKRETRKGSKKETKGPKEAKRKKYI